MSLSCVLLAPLLTAVAGFGKKRTELGRDGR